MEDVLHEYAQAIDAGKGGLILSVVGGKMSEGINFSDKLGRGVVIVGLPFPNAHSAEWKAKLEYVEKATYERLSLAEGAASKSESTKRAEAKASGREIYENACMRAVNQCIGRAIRHQNDYASILLVDKRFGTDRIMRKLPGWIQRSLQKGANGQSFAMIERSMRDFFHEKRQL